jgi:hypothetical protein
MKFLLHSESRQVASVLLMLAICSTAHAAGQGAPAKDPSRWYTPDATPQQQAGTSRKEAQAAFQEAIAACRVVARGERQACIKEAKDNLKDDLNAARGGATR